MNILISLLLRLKIKCSRLCREKSFFLTSRYDFMIFFPYVHIKNGQVILNVSFNVTIINVFKTQDDF